MAGSAWRFFAPRISAALGGGRERRRSAPGPARSPPARPPCRGRPDSRTPAPRDGGGMRGPDGTPRAGPGSPRAAPAALRRLPGDGGGLGEGH